MNTRFSFCMLAMSAIFFISCNNSGSGSATTKDSTSDTSNTASSTLREENVMYTADSTTMDGFVVYSDSIQGKRPAVLIVHEWWGLNDYPKERARQLAKMGYIAMAVDMYGGGKIANDPKEAQELATPFYKNPQLAKTRLDAALAKLKSYAQTDTSKIAAIGYCYGGYVVLNAAKLGTNLNGVVSFHGDLSGVAPDKKLLKAKVLVCHGADDKFVSQQVVDHFKKQMDSVHADYSLKVYPNATHAFTNPASTENGKKFNMPIAYNAEADRNSWNDMKDFFGRIFK
jgi:dienelactone hydrolase